MVGEGNNGSFDGSSVKLDLKAHFTGLTLKNSERRIAAETERVALELSKQHDFFGYDENLTREKIATRLVESLNPDVSHLVGLENEDKTIVGRAVFMSLNMTCSDGIDGGLLTDQMSADEIDDVVPEPLKGVGNIVKELNLSEDDRSFISMVNKVNSNSDVFDKRSVGERSQVLSDLADRPVDSPIAKSYLSLERELIISLGVSEEPPNVAITNVNVEYGSEKVTKKPSDNNKEKKPRAPSQPVVATKENTEATKENTGAIDRGIESNDRNTESNNRNTGAIDRGTKANDRNTGAIAEGTKATRENTGSIDRGTKANDRNTGAIDRGTESNDRNTESNDRNTGANNANTGAITEDIGATKENTGVIKAGTEVIGKVNETMGKGVAATEENTKLTKEKNELLRELIKITGNAKTVLSEELIEHLGLDMKNPVEADLAKKLGEETPSSELLLALRAVKACRAMKENAKHRERFGYPEDGIEGLYKMMDYIESGTSQIDDLTRNSDRFGVLYQVQNGVFDKDLAEEEYQGHKLTPDQIKEFKDEIELRMFLHNFQLAASKSTSIEDMIRTITTIHEGDLDGSLDRKFIKFFLKGESGLKRLPIAEAWNLRQKGYFEIKDLRDEIYRNRGDLLNYLRDNNRELYDKVVVLGLFDQVKGDLLFLDKKIDKNEHYGIKWDVLENYFCIQSDTKNLTRAELYKEYMLWKISQKVTGISSDPEVRKMAEKSYELANKLSIATFADSKANIDFAKDDYTEMILYKWFRYTEGPNHKLGMTGKSKPCGEAYAIRFMEAIVCHWLDVSRRDDGRMRWVYSPLYSHDIYFDKIGKASNMAYHFSSIVASQGIPIKEATSGDKVGPNDILGINGINKLFAKLNKAANELLKARIRPFYDNAEGDSIYRGLFLKKEEAAINRSTENVKAKYRKNWLLNLMGVIGMNSSGWTLEKLNNLYSQLQTNPQLFDEKGMPWTSFVPSPDLRDTIDRSRVYINVADNDAQRESSRRRGFF